MNKKETIAILSKSVTAFVTHQTPRRAPLELVPHKNVNK